MKIFKSRIFLVIITAIICTTIGVTASVLYNASEIGFTPSDTNWKVNNLNDAINDLYKGKSTAVQVATLTTQGATYTMQNDGYVVGTMRTGNGAAGAIYFNQSNHDDLGDAVAIAPSNYNNDVTVSVYASKNTIISTRTGWGTYNLTVYEWK